MIIQAILLVGCRTVERNIVEEAELDEGMTNEITQNIVFICNRQQYNDNYYNLGYFIDNLGNKHYFDLSDKSIDYAEDILRSDTMFKVAWEYIKGYKKNTIVCMLGIGFSVMLIFSLIQMSGRIMSQYWNMMMSTSTYDMRIQDIDVETMDAIYSDIQKEECVKAKEIWCASVHSEENLSTTELVGVEGQWQKLFKTELIQGREPSQKYELCVEEKYCNDKKVALGDEVELELLDDAGNEYPITFKIVGVIETLATPLPMYYIFTPYATALEITEQEGFEYDDSSNSITVLYSETSYEMEKIADLTWKLCNKYKPALEYKNIIDNDEKIEIQEEKMLYAGVNMGIYGVVGVIFLCMIIFIYNTISISMTEKIRQYGVLRCIGIDNKGLLVILGLEQLFYTVGGLIIGFVGGTLLNGVIADNIIGCFIPMENAEYETSIWLYVLTAVMTVVAVALAAVVLFSRIAKQNPVDMLKYMEKQGKIKQKKTMGSFFFEMSYRNLQRNRSKSRILMVTITLTAFLIISMGNILGTIDFDMSKSAWALADMEVSRNFLADIPYITEENVEKCQKAEEVQELYWQSGLYEYQCSIDDPKQNNMNLLVYSDNLMEKFLSYNKLKGLDYTKEEVAIAVSSNKESNGEKIQFAATDYLLELYPNAQKECEVEIDGTVPMGYSVLMGTFEVGGDDTCIIINEKLANKICGEEMKYYTTLYVCCDDILTTGTLADIMEDPSYTYSDMRHALADSENQLIGLMAFCAYILVAVTILSIFIITNLVKANFHMRMKEIGMMRSVGAELKVIKSLLCREIMILAVRAVVWGGILSVPVCLYINMVNNEEVGMGVTGFCIGIPVILGGCYMIAWSTIRKCLKVKTCDLLHCE